MAITRKVTFFGRLNFMRCSELPPPPTAIVVATDQNGLFYWIRDPQYIDGVFDDEPPHKLVTKTGEPYKPSWDFAPLSLYRSGQLRGAIDHWKQWKDVSHRQLHPLPSKYRLVNWWRAWRRKKLLGRKK